jgi:dipeptidyl aminopeptidase/acylaminoacyl peptidase
MKPIRGGLLSGVGAIVALLAISPAISWATYPGANGRIAYAGGPEAATDSDLFTINPDGSGLQQLTDSSAGHESQPSWSSTGRRLTFIRTVPEVGHQVFTINASGENQRQVTDDKGGHSSPGFSPNGKRIVYAKRRSIFKVRPDGEKRRRLVTGGYVASPVYSPNGNRIAFGGTPKGREDGVWTIRPDGTHLRRLSLAVYERNGWDEDRVLDWSPNGRRILFQRCRASGRHVNCYDRVMWPDGSHKREVNVGGDAVYAPSGRRYAYWWGETDDGILGYYCTDIATNSLSGSDPRDVTHNCEGFPDDYGGDAIHPSWQPIPQP